MWKRTTNIFSIKVNFLNRNTKKLVSLICCFFFFLEYLCSQFLIWVQLCDFDFNWNLLSSSGYVFVWLIKESFKFLHLQVVSIMDDCINARSNHFYTIFFSGAVIHFRYGLGRIMQNYVVNKIGVWAVGLFRVWVGLENYKILIRRILIQFRIDWTIIGCLPTNRCMRNSTTSIKIISLKTKRICR